MIIIKCMMQVLGHVSQRIADLHKEGYVHRDLKPGNIMWQPRTYNWVLIDFGLVARIKESVSVGCTPGYAAPETALAVTQGQKRMVVDEKVDSWALGVIAYELLLEKSAFGMFQGVNDVCFQTTRLSVFKFLLRMFGEKFVRVDPKVRPAAAATRL
jgi:serine/threonine protein kinase